jgi:hypothetical protein
MNSTKQLQVSEEALKLMQRIRRNHDAIGDIGAASNQERSLVNHAVVEPSGFLVVRVAALDELADPLAVLPVLVPELPDPLEQLLELCIGDLLLQPPALCKGDQLLLDRAAADRCLLAGYHLPGSVGVVERWQAGFRWERIAAAETAILAFRLLPKSVCGSFKHGFLSLRDEIARNDDSAGYC